MINFSKLVFLLLAAFCFGQTNMQAQNQTAPNTSILTLFAKDGEKFFVVLDGERKNAKALARVVVPNLDRGYYKVKVIFEDDKLGSIDDNIQLEGVDSRYNDVTYQIRKKKKGKAMVYVINNYSFAPLEGTKSTVLGTTTPNEGYSDAQSSEDKTTTTPTGMTQTETMPGGNMNLNVDMQGGENIMGTNVTVTTPEGERVNMGMNVDVSGMDNTSSGSIKSNSTVTTTTTTRTTRTGVKPVPAGTNPTSTQTTITRSETPAAPAPKAGCALPMSPPAFTKQLDGIKKTAFEDTRKNMAKLMLKNNCLSTAQVRQVIKSMSFEASKLEFAKAAYQRCTDKESFMEVADEFSFNSSKDELVEVMSK